VSTCQVRIDQIEFYPDPILPIKTRKFDPIGPRLKIGSLILIHFITHQHLCGLGWSLYHYHVVWWMPGWWFLVTMGLIYLICHSLLCSPVLLATNSQKLKIKLLRISFYFNVAISSLLFHFLSLSQSELGLSFLSLDLVKSPNVAFFCVCPYELDSAFFLSIVVI